MRYKIYQRPRGVNRGGVGRQHLPHYQLLVLAAQCLTNYY